MLVLILQVLMCSAHTYFTLLHFSSYKAIPSLFFARSCCTNFSAVITSKHLFCSMDLSLPTSTPKLFAFLFTDTFLLSDTYSLVLQAFLFSSYFVNFCHCSLYLITSSYSLASFLQVWFGFIFFNLRVGVYILLWLNCVLELGFPNGLTFPSETLVLQHDFCELTAHTSLLPCGL